MALQVKNKFLAFVILCILAVNINAEELGHYKLDGNAMDYSMNGRNGTINGDVTPTEDRFGNADSAMYFNGSSSIQIEAFRNFDYGKEFTVSIWFRRDKNNNAYMAIVDQGYHVSGSFELRMGREYGGTILHGLLNGENGNVELTSKNLITLGVWEHIAIVYSSGNYKYYLNGELIDQTTKDIGNIKKVDLPIYIGKHNSSVSGGEHFVGAMDDFRIFNNALTDSDISSLYQNTFDKIKVDINPKDENTTSIGSDGGRFYYKGNIINNTTDTLLHQWSVLTMPNGLDYSVSKDKEITVDKEKIYKSKYINIPKWFPAGEYTYTWYIAKPDDTKANIIYDSFKFTKEKAE